DSYSLFVLDRGRDTQGVTQAITPNGGIEVSDRFLIVDMQFLMHANIQSGYGLPVTAADHVKEMCLGSQEIFGRRKFMDQDTQEITSRKHAAIMFDMEHIMHIGDCYSTNHTRVIYRNSEYSE